MDKRTINEWEIVVLGTDTNSVCQEIALVPSDLHELSTDVESISSSTYRLVVDCETDYRGEARGHV